MMSTKLNTYNSVVLAAHDVGLAVATADANDADRRAAKPEEDIHTLHNNPEQAQERATGSGVGLEVGNGVRDLYMTASLKRRTL